MLRKRTSPSLEQLEERLVLTAWGTPWPGQLTVSFVPDGTQVGNAVSAVPANVGLTAWKEQILRALQTWAATANVDVGLVADDGSPLGTPGHAEGDSRFGDVRIAAVPLGTQSSVASGAPFDPLAGTLSGDVIFNTSQTFSVGGMMGYDLFSVALHEAGHVYGFADEDTDPTSANYDQYTGVRAGLSADDVSQMVALYGARTADAHEGPGGNETFDTATALAAPDVAGELSALGDVDTYLYQAPSYATGPITVKVQTSGLSLLTPQLRVYDANRNLIGASSSFDPLSGDVSVMLPPAAPGASFYFQVQATRGDAFGVGTYRLKVDSGPVSQYLIGALDASFDGVNRQVYNDGTSTQTQATARQLDVPEFAGTPGFAYAINATLAAPGAVNFYSVTTPAAPVGAVVFSAAAPGGAFDPELTVYDSQGDVVPVQILSNDGGSYTVQIVNPLAGATYYVAVQANTAAPASRQAGVYLLGVDYRATPIALDVLVQQTLTDANNVSVSGIQTSEAMLYHFVLTFDNEPTGADVGVAMQLYDQNNNVALTLVSINGETVSADALLGAGTYVARFVAVTRDGSALPGVSYSLMGTLLTNPLDPVTLNPLDPPPPQMPPPQTPPPQMPPPQMPPPQMPPPQMPPPQMPPPQMPPPQTPPPTTPPPTTPPPQMPPAQTPPIQVVTPVTTSLPPVLPIFYPWSPT
jgi:hypothetical protein